MLRAPRPLSPPVAPKLRKEQSVSPRVLREYLGGINYKRWVKLLGVAGVELKWARKPSGKAFNHADRARKRVRLTYAQCEAIMHAYYRQVGEFRMKRRRLV